MWIQRIEAPQFTAAYILAYSTFHHRYHEREKSCPKDQLTTLLFQPEWQQAAIFDKSDSVSYTSSSLIFIFFFFFFWVGEGEGKENSSIAAEQIPMYKCYMLPDNNGQLFPSQKSLDLLPHHGQPQQIVVF